MVIDDEDLALLVLENGDAFVGCSIGKGGNAFGEIVFATAMTGYQETLTDPSYFGQIVVQTAPEIGNTGVNQEDNESNRIWVNGYVVRQLSPTASSWRAEGLLDDQLVNDSIVGISGIDTRYLTRKLRSSGVMKAGIFSTKKVKGLDMSLYAIGDKITAPQNLLDAVNQAGDMLQAHFAADVTTAQEIVFKPSSSIGVAQLSPQSTLRVVALDLGIKAMTPQLLTQRGVEVIQVPLSTTWERIEELKPDGVFFSNGPGDPASAVHEIELLRKVLEAKYPFFGICMGNQMLGRALGFDTYKLKFGHRGINQPVKDLLTKRVEITAHNHGFAVDIPLGDPDEFGIKSNPPIVQAPYNNGQFGRIQVSHIGLNDNVVEGIRCLDIPAFSVQYHPEAAAGPHDAQYLFDRFVEMMLNKEISAQTESSTIRTIEGGSENQLGETIFGPDDNSRVEQNVVSTVELSEGEGVPPLNSQNDADVSFPDTEVLPIVQKNEQPDQQSGQTDQTDQSGQEVDNA